MPLNQDKDFRKLLFKALWGAPEAFLVLRSICRLFILFGMWAEILPFGAVFIWS